LKRSAVRAALLFKLYGVAAPIPSAATRVPMLEDFPPHLHPQSKEKEDFSLREDLACFL
jgi:hypothetical protein